MVGGGGERKRMISDWPTVLLCLAIAKCIPVILCFRIISGLINL